MTPISGIDCSVDGATLVFGPEWLLNGPPGMVQVGVDVGYVASQLFNGLMFGMILVLISLGLTLIFGQLEIINFAHGALLLVGTYSAWYVTGLTDSLFAGLVVAVGITAVIGLLMERFTLRYTYDQDPLLQFLLTFGLAYVLTGIVTLIFGRVNKDFAIPTWGSGSIDLVLFSYPAYRLFIIGFAAVIVVVTYLFLERTDIGLIIRAGTQRRQMVEVLGIDISNVFMLVFGIGAAMAGIAGVLIGPLRGAYLTIGNEFLILSFIVVIIGGIGDFRGTVVAGLLVGQVRVLTEMVYPPASGIIVYVLMAAILLIRPHGLFGTEGSLN